MVVEIEVPLSGSFGNGWTLEALHRDAVRSLAEVEQEMGKLGYRLRRGPPKLLATIVESTS